MRTKSFVGRKQAMARFLWLSFYGIWDDINGSWLTDDAGVYITYG